MEKYDKKGDISYSLGTTLTFELLLRKPEAATKIFVSTKQKRDATFDKLSVLTKTLGIPLIINNEKIFHSLSDKDNVMVIGEFKKFSSTLDNTKNHVVLVNPSNNGNLGTIFRSSSAFNAGGIAIISPACDAFDPKSIRSSMGAIFSMPFHYFSSFEEYKESAGTRDYYPFMLKAKTKLGDIKGKTPYSLIFGNEATGLPDRYLKLGTPLLIPQSSNVDSLNLDNAVSIALYSFSH